MGVVQIERRHVAQFCDSQYLKATGDIFLLPNSSRPSDTIAHTILIACPTNSGEFNSFSDVAVRNDRVVEVPVRYRVALFLFQRLTWAPQTESDIADHCIKGGPMSSTQTGANFATSLVSIKVRAFMVRALSEVSGAG